MQENETAKHIVECVQDAIAKARETFIPDLLEIDEVARILGVARIHVKRLIESGELKAVKFSGGIKVQPAALQAFIDAHTTPARLPMPERIEL